MENARANLLVLIPSIIELKQFKDRLGGLLVNSGLWSIERCGVGPIESAILATSLISKYSPTLVVLAGMAGTYSNRLKLGQSYFFLRVNSFGIGIGQGNNFVPVEQTDFAGAFEFPAKFELCLPAISLEPACVAKGLLISTGCVSNSSVDANNIKKLYPDAVAEDMESYSVAAACDQSNIPLIVIRGISNDVGDRNKANWRIAESMASVCDLLQNNLAAIEGLGTQRSKERP